MIVTTDGRGDLLFYHRMHMHTYIYDAIQYLKDLYLIMIKEYKSKETVRKQ